MDLYTLSFSHCFVCLNFFDISFYQNNPGALSTLINCPTCGGLVSNLASFCNYCGSPLQPLQIQIQASPPPSVCFYHPYIRASYVCNRCGRSICTYCLRSYGTLNLCPICFTSLTGLPSHYITAPIIIPVHAARLHQIYGSKTISNLYGYRSQT